MIKQKFFRFVYHLQRNGEPVQSSSYFLNGIVFLQMLNKWNNTQGYKYWESPEDEAQNIPTLPESLPILELGWYGPNNYHFNSGD